MEARWWVIMLLGWFMYALVAFGITLVAYTDPDSAVLAMGVGVLSIIVRDLVVIAIIMTLRGGDNE